MRTCLTILLLMAIGYASNESEDLFIKGNASAVAGQDSLACYYYEQAYREDSSSITLKETLSHALIKTGRLNEAVVVLRSVVKIYESKESWSEAFIIYRYIYDITKSLFDGNKVALTLFYAGVNDYDTFKMGQANRVWDYMTNRAILKKKLDSAIYITDTRIKANYYAIFFLKQPRIRVPAEKKVFSWYTVGLSFKD